MYGDQLLREREVLRMRLRRDAASQLPPGQALDAEDFYLLLRDRDGSYRSSHLRDRLAVRGALAAGWSTDQLAAPLGLTVAEVAGRAAAPLLASPGIPAEIDRVVRETLVETYEPDRYTAENPSGAPGVR